MQPRQRALYADRIERAIALMQRRIGQGEAPSLAELAAEAAMSDYHFHRIFRLMTGEAPGAAITRVRLAGSLPALVEGGVSAGSGQSGYATAQAYARALKATTGETPTALGRDGAKVEQLALHLSRPLSDAATQAAALQIEIVELAPLRLLAVRNIGAYAELNTGFGRLFELVLAQVAPESLCGIWGLPQDDPRFTPPAACRFVCALDTGGEGGAIDGLEELGLAGGRHLRLFAQGNYDLLHERLDALYIVLIERDLPLGDGPLLIHYLDDADEVAPSEQRAEVYLPIGPEEIA